ncbi:MAG: hypothetical protein R3B47_15015 [Bacteroidia bacterium]
MGRLLGTEGWRWLRLQGGAVIVIDLPENVSSRLFGRPGGLRDAQW